MGLLDRKPKITAEFSLTNAARDNLQRCLDENFIGLRQDNDEPKRKLREAVKANFPPAALDEFQKVLDGRSEYAWLVHNCPERLGLEAAKGKVKPQDTYTYFIGNALYEICNARSSDAIVLPRQYGDVNAPGRNIHRDSTRGDKYIIFSTPVNKEKAPIEMIHLKRAVKEMIDAGVKAQVEVERRLVDEGKYSPLVENMSLPQLLHALEVPPEESGFVKRVRAQDDATTEKLAEAVKRNGRKVPLKTGDMLAINELTFFHHAHMGKVPSGPPDQYSRLILHNPGGPRSR